MIKIKLYKSFASILLLLTILLGCSTEKDAALNIGYHNMTARYNGYFNAGEIIDQALNSYRDNHKDDYSELLTLTPFPNQSEASGIFPDMDLAIEKCSKVIYRHSMPDPNVVSNKDKEYCRWIDDNWFLIGKSYFLKREYDKAEEKFNYILNEYTGETSKYEARIWLVKIYLEKGDYSNAKIELGKVKIQMDAAIANEKSLIDLIKKDKSSKKKKSKYKKKKSKKDAKNSEPAKFPNRLKEEYYITLAHLNILKEKYRDACEPLEAAIDITKNNKNKARYEFVLAQLYQKQNDGKKATLFYNSVVKSPASYEMRFYAKIYKTLASNESNNVLREDLFKMLKDAKNNEYLDQIYFVLAEIDLKEDKREDAYKNLTASARYSINNNTQKAKTYLKLADLHFEDKLYIKSQKYYDSCITVLPKENENYDFVANKAKSLSVLVENYETYIYEDSVQRIVALPEKEREKELKRVLKVIKEQEKQRKIEEQARLLAIQERLNSSATVNSGTGSKWYFYNQRLIGDGFNDFRALWGSRKLEDNWRRSIKNSSTEFEEIALDSIENEVESLTVDILREGLPLDEDMLSISNLKLVEALYNLGMIYNNQLQEENEAVDYFTKIIERKGENEKKLPAAYQLYLINKKSQSSESKKYEKYILDNYPDSDISKVISDPNYFRNKEKLARKDLDDYEAIFRNYQYKKYIKVITACNEVISSNKENKYLEKYYLLKANAISKSGVGGKEAVIKVLRELVILSPDSEEGKQAAIYLTSLNDFGDSKSENETLPIYKLNLSEKHYFVIVVPAKDVERINDLKIKISNFNSSYFGNENLTITNTILGTDGGQILLIKSTVNFDKMKVYRDAFKSIPARSLLDSIASEFETLIISKSNFSLLMENKDISEYTKFYSSNFK